MLGRVAWIGDVLFCIFFCFFFIMKSYLHFRVLFICASLLHLPGFRLFFFLVFRYAVSHIASLFVAFVPIKICEMCGLICSTINTTNSALSECVLVLLR